MEYEYVVFVLQDNNCG